jgi:hypothetical protein
LDGRSVAGDWHPFDAAGGAVRVWLPPGAALTDADGVAWWSPDAELGTFSVVSGDATDGDGDALLAAEREGAEVDVERDERSERGGLPVRRLRYRTRRETPRVMVARGAAGRMHVGGEMEQRLADLLLVTAAARLVRVGYSVRDDAPAPMREDFAEALGRVRLGSES